MWMTKQKNLVCCSDKFLYNKVVCLASLNIVNQSNHGTFRCQLAKPQGTPMFDKDRNFVQVIHTI